MTKDDLIQFRIDKATKLILELEAEKRGLSIGALVRMWIMEKLDDNR